MNEFEVKTVGLDQQYLPTASYEKIYILHSNSNNRHMWGLFIEPLKDMSFYVVNPVSNKSNQQNLKSLVSGALTDLDKQIDYADWNVTNSQYFAELNHATKAIDQKLQEYKQKFKGATIVVI